MRVEIITIILGMLMHLSKNAGEVGSDIVTTTRAWASTTIEVLSATFVTYALLLSIIMFLQPAAAYSVEGIRHRAHAPAIYSAMHLGARIKLDQAVWAPVESAYGEEHNGSKSIKWEWGQVRGYASAVMQQIAGKLPLGTAVSEREMEYCMQADSEMASGRYFVDSCCYTGSKTIVRDKYLLKNVRPLATQLVLQG